MEICSSNLWLLSTMQCLPKTYVWKHFAPKTQASSSPFIVCIELLCKCECFGCIGNWTIILDECCSYFLAECINLNCYWFLHVKVPRCSVLTDQWLKPVKYNLVCSIPGGWAPYLSWTHPKNLTESFLTSYLDLLNTSPCSLATLMNLCSLLLCSSSSLPCMMISSAIPMIPSPGIWSIIP